MKEYDLDDLSLKAMLIKAVCLQMNERINEIGEIPQSDQTIKNWHEYDNAMWRHLLEAVLIIDQCYNVDHRLVKDCQILIDHIDQYGDYCGNVLYPTPQITGRLKKEVSKHSITVPTQWGTTETVKKATFRTMMRVRELYCDIIDLDYPNADASKGRLTASAFERLFDL
jgi:hypothetical protein